MTARWADEQRARGRGFEQGAKSTRGTDDGLRAANAASCEDRQRGGDRHPQHRNDDDRGANVWIGGHADAAPMLIEPS